jgi:beta-lactamase superfamily II metal-dependent hydrolase
MSRTSRHLLTSLCIACLLVTSARAKTKSLQVDFIDVEGGQATLIVGPTRHAILVDAGWAGFGDRDARRIVAAAHAAHVKRIDYLVLTHYHRDHAGGVPQLAARMKIGTFADHGPNAEPSGATAEAFAAYQKIIAHAPHVTVVPGEGLPLPSVTVQVVTSAGHHLDSPLPGAGTINPYCDVPELPAASGENPQSVGLLVSYGRFRFLDLGDLTADKEMELMCPNNPLGTVDVFLVSHHGAADANSPALLDALRPRVAILNNAARKGDDPAAWKRLKESPGLQDIWQLHYAVEAGEAHNAAPDYIANPEDQKDAGHFLELLADPDGNFVVINRRNGFRRAYGKLDDKFGGRE